MKKKKKNTAVVYQTPPNTYYVNMDGRGICHLLMEDTHVCSFIEKINLHSKQFSLTELLLAEEVNVSL